MQKNNFSEHVRVYKSMNLDDLMDFVSNIVARAGFLATPIVQGINYERKLELNHEKIRSQSEERFKPIFMRRIIDNVKLNEVPASITDTGRYYEIWYNKTE